MRRSRFAAFALTCLLVTGCVLGGTTVLVNPDGSAKLQIDVATSLPLNFCGRRGAVKPAEVTLDEILPNAWSDTSLFYHDRK